MDKIFQMTSRPDDGLFVGPSDPDDPRLRAHIHTEPDRYADSHIVIIGCAQDEGVKRRGGRTGAADAPIAIRRQFYRLTTFNITKNIFDIGDVHIGRSLEETHDTLTDVVSHILRDGKRVIVLGGGNDISYANGRAMASVFGKDQWIGVNIDAHLDVRIASEINSGTQYRQLLEKGFLRPAYFYEVGYQTHFTSPVHYEYIRSLGVNRLSLEMVRSRAEADLELKEHIRRTFIGHSSSLSTFFGFDLDVVRMADAPGVSAPSPLGLRAGEFIQLVKYASSLANTKVIEFTEVNPNLDIDNRTSMLVAIGMHRFCTGVS